MHVIHDDDRVLREKKPTFFPDEGVCWGFLVLERESETRTNDDKLFRITRTTPKKPGFFPLLRLGVDFYANAFRLKAVMSVRMAGTWICIHSFMHAGNRGKIGRKKRLLNY